VPTEQPFVGERLSVFLVGVEHHLDDAIHMAVGRRQPERLHPQPTSDRCTDLVLVENFALDFAGLENILRQGAEHGFIA